MDAQGNALVVWRQASGDLYDLWSRRYTVGSGWSNAELIELATGQVEYPDVGIARDGTAVVAWDDGQQVWARVLVP
jgi:uncharacterized membrane protein